MCHRFVHFTYGNYELNIVSENGRWWEIQTLVGPVVYGNNSKHRLEHQDPVLFSSTLVMEEHDHFTEAFTISIGKPTQIYVDYWSTKLYAKS